MVSNRRVLFLYKLEINRIERIYRFKRGTVNLFYLTGSGKPCSKISNSPRRLHGVKFRSAYSPA